MADYEQNGDEAAAARIRAVFDEITEAGHPRERVLSVALAEAAYAVAGEYSSDLAIEALAFTGAIIDASARAGREVETARPAGRA